MPGPDRPAMPELAGARERRLIDLAHQLDRPGPRYTSYPTAVDFGRSVDATTYAATLEAAAARAGDWSLYLHVPFCRRRCHFCACSVVATPQADRVVEPYLIHLEREIDMVSARLGARRRVAQLHLGGGTPTYLDPDALTRVMTRISHHFELREDAEVSIEVDPRVTSPAHLERLAALGFNRLSVGVQDFDPEVQALIGRVQSFDLTAALVGHARKVGFDSINLDLVYGLPGQTPERFDATLRRAVALKPERVALYGYAHMPAARGNQRRIDPATLPDGEARIASWAHARRVLGDAGWTTVGMDHFALPDDALAVADREGRLRRNFMGYTVDAGDDVLGFGLTAIGDVGGTFVQNSRKLVDYYRRIDRGELPVERGLRRSEEDRLRARVIADLMCAHRVDRAAVERDFGAQIDGGFDRHFAADLRDLAPLRDLGLVEDDGHVISLTDDGRAFVRNVAMCFDARLRTRRSGAASSGAAVRLPLFSRTV